MDGVLCDHRDLIAALRGKAEFRLGDHALLMGEGRD